MKKRRRETIRLNFTKKAIEALAVPEDGAESGYRDTQTRGLGLRIYASGRKCFTWFRKVNGRAEFKQLGEFPSTTIDQARSRANALNAERDEIRSNGAGQMFEERNGRTLGSVFAAYVVYRRATAKTVSRVAEDEDKYERFLGRLSNLKLGQIDRDQLRRIHASIPAKRVANMTIQLLRRVVNFAIREDMFGGQNPTDGLRLHKEVSRRRFLLPSELPLLLPHLDGDLRDFVFLTLQTGARKSNLCAMRWDEIQNIDGEWVWMIPTSKNGEPYNVPLLPSAMNCLDARLGAFSLWRPGVSEPRYGGTWVFPSHSKQGHVMDFKKSWDRARKAGGLRDLRIHDLRRTTGSWLAASGASLPMIGKALNHKSPASTAIYARLQLDPIREQLKQAMGLLNG